MSQDRLRVGPQDSTYLSQLLWLEVPGGRSEERWWSAWFDCSHTLSYSVTQQSMGVGGGRRGSKESGRRDGGKGKGWGAWSWAGPDRQACLCFHQRLRLCFWDWDSSVGGASLGKVSRGCAGSQLQPWDNLSPGWPGLLNTELWQPLLYPLSFQPDRQA